MAFFVVGYGSRDGILPAMERIRAITLVTLSPRDVKLLISLAAIYPRES